MYKKLIGLALTSVLAMACNGGGDGEEPPPADSSVSVGLINGVDSSVAVASVAFEAFTTDFGGQLPTPAAGLVAVATDFNNPCGLFTNAVQPPADLKGGFVVVLDFNNSDPAVAFASGSTIVGDGQALIVNAGSIFIQGQANLASGSDAFNSTLNIGNFGATLTADVAASLVLDFADQANFDTDINGDGTNDAKAITPTAMTANFEAATACPGLSAGFGL